MQSWNTWQAMSLLEVTSLYTNTGIQSCSSLIHCFVPTTISWKSADVLIIYAMSLLACGTLVPASLHKYDIGHLGHESFQSITCTDITDNQTNVSFLFRYCKIFLVAICNTRYSTTEKQFSTNVKVPLSCVVVLQRCRTTIWVTCDGVTSHAEMYSDEECSSIEINLVIVTIFYVLCRWLTQLRQHVPVNPIQYVDNSLFSHFCLFFQPTLKLVLIYLLFTLYHN